jgi:hypothetical protein
MRSSKSLEKLVAHLHGQLNESGSVLIESPKHLRDKSTGRLRRHDVVLTVTSGYQTFLVAIECRDRTRPVGSSQLAAFARKCSATSINKSAIVSPCGFTKIALYRAKTLGIHCLSPEQVKNFPWVHCDTDLSQVRTNYTRIDFAIIPEKDFVRKPTSFMLINDDGQTVSPDDLREYLLVSLIQRQRDLSDLQPGDKVERIRAFPKNLSIIDTDTGITRRIRQISVVAYCKSEKMEQSFILQEQRDIKSSTPYARLHQLLNEPDFSDVRIFMHKNKN